MKLSKVTVGIIISTFHQQPAGRRLVFSDATFVGTFVRLGKIVDGHVTCRLSPNEGNIFKKLSWEEEGSILCFTAQSDVISLHHWEDRSPQDHWFIWTWRQTDAERQTALQDC